MKLSSCLRRRGGRSHVRRSGCRASAGAAADRDQESRRHRRRLHFPQRQSPVDVRRHQGRRDRDRSDRLRAPDRRPAICRRDQEGHRQADQVPDLQPRPLRSHRGRQGLQGRRRQGGRAQERDRAAQDAEGPAHRDAGRVDRRQESHQARRYHAGASLPRAQPLQLDAGDAAAEGEDRVHRRHDSGRAHSRAAASSTSIRSRPRSSSRRSSRWIGIA